MAIELPRVLKNMNLFVDGRGYAGRIDEIQLPKLTLKTEEAKPVTVNLRCVLNVLDAGTGLPCDKSTLMVSVAASYYKLTIDDEELIEIDAINLVRKVGGTDQMEAIRAAIGL